MISLRQQWLQQTFDKIVKSRTKTTETSKAERVEGYYKTFVQIADIEKDTQAAMNICKKCMEKHKAGETMQGRPYVRYNTWSERLQFIHMQGGFVDESKTAWSTPTHESSEKNLQKGSRKNHNRTRWRRRQGKT